MSLPTFTAVLDCQPCQVPWLRVRSSTCDVSKATGSPLAARLLRGELPALLELRDQLGLRPRSLGAAVELRLPGPTDHWIVFELGLSAGIIPEAASWLQRRY